MHSVSAGVTSKSCVTLGVLGSSSIRGSAIDVSQCRALTSAVHVVIYTFHIIRECSTDVTTVLQFSQCHPHILFSGDLGIFPLSIVVSPLYSRVSFVLPLSSRPLFSCFPSYIVLCTLPFPFLLISLLILYLFFLSIFFLFLLLLFL